MFKITKRVEGRSLLGGNYPPGVYENGLITIPTIEDSSKLNNAIEWPVYHKYKIVAYNCMGDLFIQGNESPAIGYLWLQFGYGRFIAKTATDWISLIYNEGLDKEKFLETFAFNYVSKFKGYLPYGSIYTLNPIRALGGGSDTDALDKCDIGHLDVYISIVSQTFIPDGWGQFA